MREDGYQLYCLPQPITSRRPLQRRRRALPERGQLAGVTDQQSFSRSPPSRKPLISRRLPSAASSAAAAQQLPSSSVFGQVEDMAQTAPAGAIGCGSVVGGSSGSSGSSTARQSRRTMRPASARRTVTGGWCPNHAGDSATDIAAMPPEMPPMPFGAAVYQRRAQRRLRPIAPGHLASGKLASTCSADVKASGSLTLRLDPVGSKMHQALVASWALGDVVVGDGTTPRAATARHDAKLSAISGLRPRRNRPMTVDGLQASLSSPRQPPPDSATVCIDEQWPSLGTSRARRSVGAEPLERMRQPTAGRSSARPKPSPPPPLSQHPAAQGEVLQKSSRPSELGACVTDVTDCSGGSVPSIVTPRGTSCTSSQRGAEAGPWQHSPGRGATEQRSGARNSAGHLNEVKPFLRQCSVPMSAASASSATAAGLDDRRSDSNGLSQFGDHGSCGGAETLAPRRHSGIQLPLSPSASTRATSNDQQATATGTSSLAIAPSHSRAAKEEVWRSVFAKLRDDGELHKDDLARALELCGFAPTNQEWIEEVFSELTQYTTLEETEFLTFTSRYQKRQHRAQEEAFIRCDANGNGYVEREELAELLRSFGIEPMTHVLDEVLDEVDMDGQGSLDLAEFRQVMEILWVREGYTKKEYNSLMLVYRLFDRDSSGDIDARELRAITDYLGYSIDKASIQGIVDEVDVDGSGQINEREYLMCMRKVREREIQAVAKAARENDTNNNGTISMDELPQMFQVLGYDGPDLTAIRESAEAVGLDPEDKELDLCELWRLLTMYRTNEGLSMSEAARVQEAFSRYDKERCGEISTLEVGKVLRFLGYSLSFEVLQQFISRVDVDESGKLSIVELRKMVRMLRERDLNTYREAWVRFAGTTGAATVEQATEVLSDLGLLDGLASGAGEAFLPEEIESVSTSDDEQKEKQVFYDGFLRAAFRHGTSKRERYKQNGGFTAIEVEQMRDIFKHFDFDRSGDICNKELICLIEYKFPEMAHDRDLRPKLLEIMHEVDADGSGSLDFQDFLRLMKQCRDLQDRERLQKEAIAISETGFTPQEVNDFRELFLACDDGTGELTLQNVTKMVNQITPLGDKYKAELATMFRSVTGRQLRVEGQKDEADFPEFLWLMKQLLERNFANIQEKTRSFGS